MTVSLVINSCANGPKAAETKSSGGQPHAQRSFALRNFILPAAVADPTFSEVIVVGEWEPGWGYIYIEVPSERFSCVDALAQRQAGFERSTGDVVIFQHDDHMLAPDVGSRTKHSSWANGGIGAGVRGEVGVIVPARYTRLRDVNGEKLLSGEPSDKGKNREGYISGHCTIYRRGVLERCPWSYVKKVFAWDIEHTKQIREAGFEIEWRDTLYCYDCEAGAKPWG